MSELMKELGFNKEASFEAKKAFLKYLFKQADIKQKERSLSLDKKPQEPVQLSLFDQECA